MVINGIELLLHSPIKDMRTEKHRLHGVSHGLGEVGYDIRIKQEVIFTPDDGHGSVSVDDEYEEGNFTLASAMDEFAMPTNLMGIVHDKSTWARRGLSVFNTVIEPGWKGFLTLELAYHGRKTLYIPAGAGIAQVIFHRLSHHAEYEGKYQNQANQPVAAIADES